MFTQFSDGIPGNVFWVGSPYLHQKTAQNALKNLVKRGVRVDESTHFVREGILSSRLIK
jgi:hypothetical protein